MEISMLTIHQYDALSRKVQGDADQVWFDVEHPNSNVNGNFFLDPERQAQSNLVSVLGIRTQPSIIFLQKEDNRYRVISRLQGNVSYTQIRNVYENLLRLSESGGIVGENLLINLNLEGTPVSGNFGNKFPWWILILIGLGVYQAQKEE